MSIAWVFLQSFYDELLIFTSICCNWGASFLKKIITFILGNYFSATIYLNDQRRFKPIALQNAGVLRLSSFNTSVPHFYVTLQKNESNMNMKAWKLPVFVVFLKRLFYLKCLASFARCGKFSRCYFDGPY
jgi:hypothetical protein